jgi:hypothetical protein
MYIYISKDDELRIEDDSQDNLVEPNAYPDNAGGGQAGFPGGGDFDYAEYGDMTDSFTRSDRNDENRNNGRVRGRGEGRMQNTNRYQSNDNYEGRYGSRSEDLPDVPPEWLSVSSDMDSPITTGDIPSDLSADDVATVIPFAHNVVVPSVHTVDNVTTVDQAAAAAALTVEVLKQLDSDYMALRAKLIGLIQSQGEIKVQGAGLGEVQGLELEHALGQLASLEADITESNHDHDKDNNHSGRNKGVDRNDHTGDSEGVDIINEESPPPRVQYWPTKKVISESV